LIIQGGRPSVNSGIMFGSDGSCVELAACKSLRIRYLGELKLFVKSYLAILK